MDGIDEVHELDPVHQVDHKNERCDDIGGFWVDIGRFSVDIGRFSVDIGRFFVFVENCRFFPGSRLKK